MKGADYRALAKDLGSAGIFRPRLSYGVLTVGAEIAVFGLAFAALVAVEPLSPAYFALSAFLGLSMFRFFVIVHECGHRSLFQSRLACDVAGTIASMFCLVPLGPWRHIHYLHHKWVGVIDKDPTQQALLALKEYGAVKNFFFRAVWKLWLPVMFATFIVSVFWAHPFKQLRDGDRKQGLRGLGSLAFVLLPRIAAFAVFGWKLALLYMVPMTYVFLFIDENVSLPQHTGLFPYLSSERDKPIPLHEQDGVTRTTAGASLFSVLFAYNFNLHSEHHLFPSVPWYWLPRVTARVEALETYKRVNFAKYMLSIRSRDPVEVYTKALPPHTKAGDGRAVIPTTPESAPDVASEATESTA